MNDPLIYFKCDNFIYKHLQTMKEVDLKSQSFGYVVLKCQTWVQVQS